MAAQQGIVRVHRNDQVVTFQVEGWGRMQQSLPIRRLGERCLAEGTVRFRMDLRHCTYLDSTFLGTLLYLQRAIRRQENGELLLVSPSRECTRLLQQIGVDGCFATTVQEEATDLAWKELPCQTDDHEAFNQNVIQAHEELANVGGPAGVIFQKVTRGLQEGEEGTDS